MSRAARMRATDVTRIGRLALRSESVRRRAATIDDADVERALDAHRRALSARGITEAEWRADLGIAPSISDRELTALVIAFAGGAD